MHVNHYCVVKWILKTVIITSPSCFWALSFSVVSCCTVTSWSGRRHDSRQNDIWDILSRAGGYVHWKPTGRHYALSTGDYPLPALSAGNYTSSGQATARDLHAAHTRSIYVTRKHSVSLYGIIRWRLLTCIDRVACLMRLQWDFTDILLNSLYTKRVKKGFLPSMTANHS